MVDMTMQISLLFILLGAIVMCVGMAWAMIDGRLWNNPGEGLMHWGMGIAGFGGFIFLVSFFCFTVQCTLTTTCQL